MHHKTPTDDPPDYVTPALRITSWRSAAEPAFAHPDVEIVGLGILLANITIRLMDDRVTIMLPRYVHYDRNGKRVLTPGGLPRWFKPVYFRSIEASDAFVRGVIVAVDAQRPGVLPPSARPAMSYWRESQNGRESGT
jgi:hypothetical protein